MFDPTQQVVRGKIHVEMAQPHLFGDVSLIADVEPGSMETSNHQENGDVTRHHLCALIVSLISCYDKL